jgi:hypothetical protein
MTMPPKILERESLADGEPWHWRDLKSNYKARLSEIKALMKKDEAALEEELEIEKQVDLEDQLEAEKRLGLE